MAHRKPTTVETHGDAKRLANAVASFIVELTLDRRVLTFQHTWLEARKHTDQEFEHLLAEHPETIALFVADVHARDHAAAAPFVRTLLHRLPASWTDMITANLLRAFRTAHYHGHSGHDRADRPPPSPPATPPQFGVQVQLQPSHPRGRVPQDPYPVTHNMRWLYRRYVQEKRDSLRVLAGEHASSTNRDADDCLRDVKRCLKQAWTLLDLAAASEWPEPGRIVVPEK